MPFAKISARGLRYGCGRRQKAAAARMSVASERNRKRMLLTGASRRGAARPTAPLACSVLGLSLAFERGVLAVRRQSVGLLGQLHSSLEHMNL